jgi:hypothetical protein
LSPIGRVKPAFPNVSIVGIDYVLLPALALQTAVHKSSDMDEYSIPLLRIKLKLRFGWDPYAFYAVELNMRRCHPRPRGNLRVFVRAMLHHTCAFPAPKKQPGKEFGKHTVSAFSVSHSLHPYCEAGYRDFPIGFISDTSLCVLLEEKLDEVHSAEVACLIEAIREVWVVNKVVSAMSTP